VSAQPVDIEKIVAPLAGAKPCGESAKYEPEYENLEAEIAKESGITPKPVDWSHVQRNAQAILETKSKDLLVGAYLAYALFDKRGYAGLAGGLKVLRAFVQNFWEDVYPEKKRMRGRVAAFEWLGSKLERAIEQNRPAAGEAAALAECTAVFEELGKLLETQLGRDAPDMSKAQRLLREHAREAERPAPPSTPPPGAAAAGGGAAGPISVATEQDVPKALRAIQATARAVASFIRAQKLEDPRSYRMTRIGAWILIDQLPQQQNGVTPLAAVPPAVVQKYNGYITEQKFAVLLPEVEESFAKAPFWLDAHRLTAVALENLGPAYAAARTVVIGELAAFLKRLPELLNYKFSDGTPFANEQTRLWIEQEVLAGGGEGAAAASGAGESESAPWLAGQTQAKQLAVKGKVGDALDLLRAGAQQSQSQRERFGWELAQAKFCIEAGMQQVALPQLEHLDRQTEKFALDDWEPALSLEVARLLLLCYAQSAEKNKKLKETYGPKAESLYARICRLDINAALKLDMKAFQ
jgi:type VI secretion system protein VasJ